MSFFQLIDASLRVDMVCLRRKRQALTSHNQKARALALTLPASLENTRIKKFLRLRRCYIYEPETLKDASMNTIADLEKWQSTYESSFAYSLRFRIRVKT